LQITVAVPPLHFDQVTLYRVHVAGVSGSCELEHLVSFKDNRIFDGPGSEDRQCIIDQF